MTTREEITKLVERLRNEPDKPCSIDDIYRAADTIESLLAENERVHIAAANGAYSQIEKLKADNATLTRDLNTALDERIAAGKKIDELEQVIEDQRKLYANCTKLAQENDSLQSRIDAVTEPAPQEHTTTRPASSDADPAGADHFGEPNDMVSPEHALEALLKFSDEADFNEAMSKPISKYHELAMRADPELNAGGFPVQNASYWKRYAAKLERELELLKAGMEMGGT